MKGGREGTGGVARPKNGPRSKTRALLRVPSLLLSKTTVLADT